MNLKIREYNFDWGKRTYLMGILNVTPDSFSDGGEFDNIESALSQAKFMMKHGVDIIDIGGQSARPGAREISIREELDRVIPVIKALRQESSFPVSIDTTRANVANAAIEAGADIVNDISGATFDVEMLPTVARLQVPIILMHMRGTSETMQQMTEYEDLIGEIYQFFKTQIAKAIALGVQCDRLIIDPGIGFAKDGQQNIELLKRTKEFCSLEAPILIGTSRKSFIGRILNKDNPKDRVWGTAATCCAAIANGADILRVHDVAEMFDVIKMADAIWRN
jgi:dihydropteroate synthase